MQDQPRHAFDTRAVHAGERLEPGAARPVSGAIHPSVGYTFADSATLDAVLGDASADFVYSARYGNPTVRAFERAIASLEQTEDAFAFASGMAALHMALLAAGVRAGGHVVAAADIYGATYTLLQRVFAELGATVTFVDVLDLAAVADAVAARATQALVVETISNPLLKVADLPALARIAHNNGAHLLVDNTFASPYLVNPAGYGADMVIHSATKFIAGHGDVMAGVVATSAAYRARLLDLTKLIGSSAGPFEAWLALRGLKTLSLRLQRQCASALDIAAWLTRQPGVGRVNYPFLPDHPQIDLMHRLSDGRGGGGVLSFTLDGAGRAEVFAFMDALRLVQPATTLGDIYSLVLYPAISSHRSLTAAERRALGIGDDLVRLSVGIEAAADIKADLAQALARARD